MHWAQLRFAARGSLYRRCWQCADHVCFAWHMQRRQLRLRGHEQVMHVRLRGRRVQPGPLRKRELQQVTNAQMQGREHEDDLQREWDVQRGDV